MKKLTQLDRVKKYIKDFGSITQFEAFNELGILRLAACIYLLRKNGENIGGEFIKVKNRYGETCEVKRYFYEVQNG